MELAFRLVNLAVLPFWLAMIVLPNWRLTRAVMNSPLVLVPLPVLYVGLLIPNAAGLGVLFSNPQLDDIAAVLSRPEGALIAWVHFVAFDLFVGRWVYLDGRARQANPWLMAPVLLLTLLLGPCGLLAYLLVRALTPGGQPTPPAA